MASDWIIAIVTEVRETHHLNSQTELGEAEKEGSDAGVGKVSLLRQGCRECVT